MAEKHRAQAFDLELDGRLEAGQKVAVGPRELARGVRGELVAALAPAVEEKDHLALAVAGDEACVGQRPHPVQHLDRVPARGEVAAEEDEIRLLAFHLGEHGLQRRQVAVHVVQSRHLPQRHA